MLDRKDCYDDPVEIEGLLIQNGLIDELFFLEDYKQRKLNLNSDIEQSSVAGIVRNIMRFNADDKGIDIKDRKPILLYIATNGGDVDAGFELIDAIKASKTPVYTINMGNQYSMGFMVGLAGHRRYAMPNSKFLMHDGSQFIYTSGAKAQDVMMFRKRAEERVRDYILSHSKLTPEEYDSKLRVEWFLFADEAKEKGFVDYIIGVDCDIDDII